MNKLIKASLLAVGLSFAALALAKPPVENLHWIKTQLENYVQSGHYRADMHTQFEKAEAYLNQRLAENKNAKTKKKLAIVFDIDETTLSNYAVMKKLSFGGTEKMNEDAMLAANDPAIKPALSFYRYAEKHHVAVFFITGRSEWLKKATVKNLKAAGYTKWNGLYLAPNKYDKKSIVPFKSHEREMIEKKGYDIVLTIGDQWSDLDGGYADRKIKLPDPFYYIP